MQISQVILRKAINKIAPNPKENDFSKCRTKLDLVFFGGLIHTKIKLYVI